MKRKYFWCLLVLAFISRPAFCQQKPNIIFIMADDLGSAELGCYGNSFNETPNLDQLAGEGAKFTQAYAAAPICSPSRAGIMTGQYPARTRITDFLDNNADRYLDPEKYYTVNRALSDAGYHTAIIGKWHLDTRFSNPRGNARQHGFEEVIGTETKYIADGDYFFPYDKISTFTTGAKDEYLTDRQCAEASAFIKRNKDRPFFLYLTFYSVHTKLDAPEYLVKKYKEKFDQKYGAGKAEAIYGPQNIRHEADHPDNPYLAAMIERIDAGVGGIMETLKQAGLDKNTAVLFFSDNGGVWKLANNGNLRAGKSWLYEGGIRENLIVRWPAVVKPGTVIDTRVMATDFYPTFLAIANARNKKKVPLDGKSILPLLRGEPMAPREPFYWHYPSETGKWVNRMCSAVRDGDYKLLYFYKDKRIELYNLQKDPSEKINIAAGEPEKRDALKKKLDAWLQAVNAEQPGVNVKSR
ncbi:N-acetylgalactosamine-6-sulfatase [Niabella ginsenosidivorans]|uniref:N-acetylgalactosamine-6-sulfatase n=1 Tax=Niabella ginsenosidivorans TaxID=1176587 RepID=A0A1A9HYF0_9BACT|nr:sulfatase [Niabella ginsenosidivorans]ANH80273.1 N-acetylgalactosamine-6-sulfatase [Niabella ginsenosidivorans]